MSKIERLAKEKEGPKVVRSKRYMIFLIIFMGLVGLLDQYLSLIETYTTKSVLEHFVMGSSEFAFWQGIYGILTFAVFFIAWYTDAYGRKKGILVLMLVLGIPALLIGLIGPLSFHLFMVLYAVVILGTLSNMWELPIVEEAPAKRRGLYGGITYLVALIPLYAIVGPIVARTLGWQWAYGMMFFFMLGLLVLWYFFKEPEIWQKDKKERGSEILKIKTAFKTISRKDVSYLVISSIVYGLWTIAFKLVVTWGGYYYMTWGGKTPEEFQSILTVGALLLMLGALLTGILTDKIGRNGTLVIGCAGAAIGFFLTPTLIVIFYWLIYIFMPIILGWIMIFFNEIFPTRIRSTAVGISNTTCRLSYVLGPLLASALLLAFDNPTNQMVGFWIVGGIVMVIPIVALLIRPYETKGKTLEEIQEKR